MKGVLRMAWLHAVHARGATLTLIACLGLTALLPLVTRLLVTRYSEDLTARAHETPLVLGPKGNRFDLTLGALYFRTSPLAPVPYTLVRELGKRTTDGVRAVPIPVSVRFTARGRPVVATSPEYYELRGLRVAEGTRPLVVGEAALGADVARELGLTVGDELASDPEALYDLAKPGSLVMRVTGVFAPTGTADDGAVFCDVKTAWVLEGIAHGHEDASEVDDELVLARADGNVALSGALIEHQEIRAENLGDFHVHAGDELLPLTAILVVPADPRSDTILFARYKDDGTQARAGDVQMVRPREVVDDLLAVVFGVQRLIDLVSAALGAGTLLLAGLVLLLSMKLRARERETLHKLGCSPGAVAQLFGGEILLVLVASGVLAVTGTLLCAYLAPDLTAALTK